MKNSETNKSVEDLALIRIFLEASYFSLFSYKISNLKKEQNAMLSCFSLSVL